MTAVPLIIQAGKAMSEAAKKWYSYKLSCWYNIFHEKYVFAGCPTSIFDSVRAHSPKLRHVVLTLISRKTNFNFDRNFRCGFDRASNLVIPENKKKQMYIFLAGRNESCFSLEHQRQ